MSDIPAPTPTTPPSAAPPPGSRKWITALLLSIFLGFWGIDRFYTGHTLLGVLKFLTCGGFWVWWLVDVILIVTNSYYDKEGNPLVK